MLHPMQFHRFVPVFVTADNEWIHPPAVVVSEAIAIPHAHGAIGHLLRSRTDLSPSRCRKPNKPSPTSDTPTPAYEPTTGSPPPACGPLCSSSGTSDILPILAFTSGNDMSPHDQRTNIAADLLRCASPVQPGGPRNPVPAPSQPDMGCAGIFSSYLNQDGSGLRSYARITHPPVKSPPAPDWRPN